MARQTIIRLKDDLDGTDASVTIQFSWDGTAYEIDLSKKNAAAFAKAVTPYTESARRVTATRGRIRTAGRSVRATSKPDLSAVRQWAGKNGYNVAARGRIPATVTEAFTAAQAAPSSTSPPAKATARKTPARKSPAKKAAPRKATLRKAAAKRS